LKVEDGSEMNYVPEIVIDDQESADYWRHIREHRLSVQRCTNCGHLRWPPHSFCNSCSSGDYEWLALAGQGNLYSWTVTHQVFLPEWRDEVPYTVGMVRVDEQEDILIVGTLVDFDSPPTAGMRVEVSYVDCPGDVTLACWRPAG
jgi:uncharacterized protein